MSTSDDDRGRVPEFGRDYDLARWSTGEREGGELIWHTTLPSNEDWKHIQNVTLERFNPDGENQFRNYRIHPDRPLNPWGTYAGQEDYYDLDDLAFQAFDYYGWEF